jgi:hypothetical protein
MTQRFCVCGIPNEKLKGKFGRQTKLPKKRSYGRFDIGTQSFI